MPIQRTQTEDPFVNTLNRIVNEESSRQMWIGEQYSSRDSYINSHSTKKERWWRPITRYTTIDTTDNSPSFVSSNKHIYKPIPFTNTSYQTITISVN